MRGEMVRILPAMLGRMDMVGKMETNTHCFLYQRVFTTGTVTLSQAPNLSHSPWLPQSCVFYAFKTSTMWIILIHC